MTVIRECFIATAKGGIVNHRIAMFNGHGLITSIVSQMDVLRFIMTHMKVIEDKLLKSLEELGFMQRGDPVVTVYAHEPTLTALSKMAKSGVSGAPVIVDSGEVIANLSVSDLRALQSEHFGVLALPVAEFLALEHKTAYVGYSRTSSSLGDHPYFASDGKKKSHTLAQNDIQVYSVYRNSTLLQALKKLSEFHLHRLYVVEETQGFKRVEAVLSLTDVLQWMAGVF